MHVAAFNRLFGTTYSQEVDSELDLYPRTSNIDRNNEPEMDVSGDIEEQLAANLSPNIDGGDTDAPAAVTCNSNTTSVGGEDTADCRLLVGGGYRRPNNYSSGR